MPIVGLFEFRGIYEGVVRSDKREEQGQAECNTDGGSQGRPEGIDLKL